MSVEQFRETLMKAIIPSKSEQNVTYKNISDRTEENGEYVSESTVKAIFHSNGVGHKIANILAIAGALGIDYMALHADVRLTVENDYLKKDVDAKSAQIESMRDTIKKHEIKEIEMRRSIKWLVVGLVVLLLLLCIALACDFLQPGVGWYRG